MSSYREINLPRNQPNTRRNSKKLSSLEVEVQSIENKEIRKYTINSILHGKDHAIQST